VKKANEQKETVEKQLRSARSEVKEFREWLDCDRKRITELEKGVKDAETLKQALYAGFAQERSECIARLQRLEMRIHALGYAVPRDQSTSR
jgi:phage shock protein A